MTARAAIAIRHFNWKRRTSFMVRCQLQGMRAPAWLADDRAIAKYHVSRAKRIDVDLRKHVARGTGSSAKLACSCVA